ncbi:MAG TPA: hypothetical protein VFO70_04690 [Chitinophagaceae bacterium]|nr:hypothetical protein [Chitinophagaceae bacterium]
MKKFKLTISFIFLLYLSFGGVFPLYAQEGEDSIYSFYLRDSVRITIDRPASFQKYKETIICLYGLPNGNTTEQTMGRKLVPGLDWHYDIQHIRAQTKFIREHLPKNFVVIYLENNFKSWPMWSQRNGGNHMQKISQLIDTIWGLFPLKKKSLYLNGHSGGGRLIFAWLGALERIPNYVKRISFLDSDYGYDSTYYPLFRLWLHKVKGSALNVFAYNDSVALYNGKPFVSATGGTWYRSHLFLRHLERDFEIRKLRDDSLVVYGDHDKRVQFFLKPNPDRQIYHTRQVELNGFIHSILCGTLLDSKNYRYYGPRAYNDLIE